MGKFLVRVTLIFTSIYFLLSFYVAQMFGVDLIVNYYVIPFELCVVVYCFSEGKYHCRFIKYLALSIFLTDSISFLDNSLNFLSVSEHNEICFVIISTGIGVTLYKAIEHYYDVVRIKQKRKKLYEHNGNDIKL